MQARFGAPVTVKNLAVSGMNAPWGITQMPAAIAEAPDLFLIAFGMNDASARCASPSAARAFAATSVTASPSRT